MVTKQHWRSWREWGRSWWRNGLWGTWRPAGRPGETPIPIPHWNQTLSSMPCNTAMTQSVGASYNRYHIQMVMYESAKNRKGQSGIVERFAFLWCLLRSMKKQGKTVFSVAVFLSGGKCVWRRLVSERWSPGREKDAINSKPSWQTVIDRGKKEGKLTPFTIKKWSSILHSGTNLS